MGILREEEAYKVERNSLKAILYCPVVEERREALLV